MGGRIFLFLEERQCEEMAPAQARRKKAEFHR